MVKKKTKKKNRGVGSEPAIVRPESIPYEAVARKVYVERLPCPADPIAVGLAGKELADIVAEQEQLDEERREVLAGFREKQSSIKDRQKKAATTVRNGTEPRPVKCVDWLLPDNPVKTTRQDTGEVLETRTATPEELQEEIPVANGKDHEEGDDEEGLEDGASLELSEERAPA